MNEEEMTQTEERSYQQNRILATRQKDDHSYFNQCLLELEQTIERHKVEASILFMINRYEILQKTVQASEGEGTNGQQDFNHPIIEEIDLRFVDAERLRDEVKVFCEAQLTKMGEADHGTMIRVGILRMPEERTMLCLTVSALVIDSTSLLPFANEWIRHYEGDHALEQEDAIQFQDINQWIWSIVQGEQRDEGQAYWDQEMESFKETDLDHVKLPFEREQSSTRYHLASYKGGSFRSLSTGIEKLSEQLGVSKPAILLSAWASLLSRLTSEDRVPIGVAMNGRSLDELKEVIGPLSKHVLVGMDQTRQRGLAEAAVETDKKLAEATDWQEYFDLNLWFDQHVSFPFCFEYREMRFTGSTAQASFESTYECWDRFKLKLLCLESEGAVRAQLYYDAAYYTERDIQRLYEWFYTLVEQALQEPHQTTDAINILTASEMNLLLVEKNQTERSISEKCLHQIIEEQALTTPDHIAIHYMDQQITYQELNERANQFAHYLRKHGVEQEQMVAVYMERSPEMIVAIIGALKAGAAYVPLDPTYPTDRIALILADADCAFVATQERLSSSLQHDRVICMDTEWETIAQESKQSASLPSSPNQLAYMIYTSGSTGKPKGVMIEQKSLVNYIQWCVETYGIAKGSGSLVHSSIGFDLTVTSLFSSLCVGKSIILLPESQDHHTLAEHMVKHKDLSLIKITPAHLELLRHTLDVQQLDSTVQSVVIGGEQLMGESLSFWQQALPNTRFFNEYGPTEATVGCCVYEIPNGKSISGNIPIGQPIANTKLYILNQALQPQPEGFTGELYIGGDVLARGYWNREELDAERFIQHPFDNTEGSRLYRTGDLVRYTEDGPIEFLGRVDTQIKLRGYRIELGEIESALMKVSGVQEAVVVLIQAAAQHDNHLTGYVVLERSSNQTGDAIREELLGQLPEYMVPTHMIVLDALPLTEHGKVDRKHLIESVEEYSRANHVYEGPQTPIEEMVVTVLQELTGATEIGRHDNIYSLGWDSIRAIQLMARVRSSYGVILPTTWLFNNPTVKGIGEKIDALITEKLVKDLMSMDEAAAARLLEEADEDG